MTHSLGQELTLPPETVRDAIVRLLDPEFPIDLSPSVRWAFSILLRRVQADDGEAAFWVKRINFSSIVERCDKTVTNWLNELENCGLITREQGRTNWGAFKCLTVRLTDLAVLLLGLDQDTIKSRRKKTSHAPITGNQQSKETVRDLAKASKGTLPSDLAFLETEDLRRSAIFKLMALARNKGKRLSDVVSVCKQQILNSRKKFAYIAKLISLDKDYAYLSVQATKQAQESNEETAQELALKAAWERVAGRSIIRPKSIIDFATEYMQPSTVYENQNGCKGACRGFVAGKELAALAVDSVDMPCLSSKNQTTTVVVNARKEPAPRTEHPHEASEIKQQEADKAKNAAIAQLKRLRGNASGREGIADTAQRLCLDLVAMTRTS